MIRLPFGVDRIELRAHPGAAARDGQHAVVDLGVHIAEASRHQQPVGDQELAFELEAHACALVGIDELHEVAAAADGGQLLVLDLVVEDRTVQAHLAGREIGLEPDFDPR